MFLKKHTQCVPVKSTDAMCSVDIFLNMDFYHCMVILFNEGTLLLSRMARPGFAWVGVLGDAMPIYLSIIRPF